MSAVPDNLPTTSPPSGPAAIRADIAKRPTLHQMAHAARIQDLQDFDWKTLDYDTAMKFHTMLPADKPLN